MNTISMDTIKLDHVDAGKYLGLTITSDFFWNTHNDNIVKKASYEDTSRLAHLN